MGTCVARFDPPHHVNLASPPPLPARAPQVPKDTVALLEPDLRRNLTALLTDSVPAALTPRLVDRLTKTVAPPLTDQLVASLEADLPERLLRSLHARTAAPLLVTLPDRLKRSLLTSLTHTLSHTLPHVLVPSIGEALLAQGVAAAAAMGGGSFPIPLSEACATCPHNPAVKDKSACWACRRDEFRYWVLHQSHCECRGWEKRWASAARIGLFRAFF